MTSNSNFEALASLLTRLVTAVESIEINQKIGTQRSKKAKISSRAKPVKTLDQIVRKYMRKHRQAFTKYLIDANQWIRPTVAGSCMGRLQRDRLFGYSFVPGWSIAIPASEFASYCSQYGLSSLALKRLLKDGSQKKRLRLVKSAPAIRCFVIPLPRQWMFQTGPLTGN